MARKTTLDGEINELGGERGGERGERERRGRKSNECEQRKEGDEGGSKKCICNEEEGRKRRGGFLPTFKGRLLHNSSTVAVSPVGK